MQRKSKRNCIVPDDHEIYEYLKPKLEGTPDMSLIRDASTASTIQPSIPGQSEQQQEVKTPVRLCEKCGLPEYTR